MYQVSLRTPLGSVHTTRVHASCSRAPVHVIRVHGPSWRPVSTGVKSFDVRQHDPWSRVVCSLYRPQRSHAKYHISMQIRLFLLQCNTYGYSTNDSEELQRLFSPTNLPHDFAGKGVLIYIPAYLKSTLVQIQRQLLDSGASEELQTFRLWWNKSDGHQAECRWCLTVKHIETRRNISLLVSVVTSSAKVQFNMPWRFQLFVRIKAYLQYRDTTELTELTGSPQCFQHVRNYTVSQKTTLM